VIDRALGALTRRTPTTLLLLVLAVVGAVRLTVFVFARWWLSWPLMLLGLGWWSVHRYGAGTVVGWLVVAVLLLVAAVAVWSWLGPDSFGRVVVLPWRSWRRRRHYERRWDEAMLGTKLERAGVVPMLMSCHGGETVDELLVHMAPGSLVTDWRDAAQRLASAFEVRSVRVRSAGPRDVRLLVRHSAVSRHEWPADVDTEVAEVAAQPAEHESNEQLAERIAAELPEPTELPRPAFPRRPR
jgi:hypothetical protein